MASSTENMYVVYCVDAPFDQTVEDPNGGRRRGGVRRMSYLNEHNAYQVATSSPGHECFIHKIAVVPMLAEDGVTMIGSCFLIKASREECERFIHSDPFFVNKVWEKVTISRFSGAAAKGNTVPAKATAGASIHFHSMRV